ncbi:MAG: TolC family protein, partial [Oxalobacteraceae bacterium]|nr:TolC family protein [Oxalobacteraceae bacterium]
MKIFVRKDSLLKLVSILTRLAVLICLLSLLPAPTLAAPEISVPASYPLPIEELVAEAMSQNLELRSYEAELRAARGERRQAGMWKNPELEGEYGYRRVTDPQEILVGEGVSRGLAIVQTFEFPGKGSLRKAIANQNIRLAELGVQQFRQALAGQIRSLGIRWILVRENAEATAELSERSQALLQLLEARPMAGPTKLLEFRAIQGSLTDLHFTARELQQKQEEIRIQLNSLLGRPANQEIRLALELGTPAFPVGDIPELVRSGEDNNLQLRMRHLELERAVKAVSS